VNETSRTRPKASAAPGTLSHRALLFLGWLILRFGVPDVVPNIMFGLAILIGAYYWAREGVEEFVKEREVGIEALMAFATIGAVILGEYFEAAFLVFLYAGAEAIEMYTFARTRSAIRALLDLAPETAIRLRDGAAG
jgi:Cd2+/Zn2+-exporting ATPase